MKIELAEKRKIAANASKGTSSDAIYSAFENLLIELNSPDRIKILDFGAGTGNLTKRIDLLKLNCSISAIDIMPRPSLLEKDIEWISHDLNNETNFVSESFDVIVSAEVIEHLENPREVVREWFRLLRPQGTLIFSTPNNESYRSLIALLFKGHYAAFSNLNYPAHITPLLRKDAERILQETGFSQPKFVFTNSGMIPKVTFLKWQQISGGLLKGLRYSDNLIVIAKKIV